MVSTARQLMTLIAHADATEAGYRGIAEGLVLQALGPLVAAASTALGATLRKLLDAHNLGVPDVPSGSRTFPDYSGFAPPIHSPVQKDRVRLQVCGVPVCGFCPACMGREIRYIAYHDWLV